MLSPSFSSLLPRRSRKNNKELVNHSGIPPHQCWSWGSNWPRSCEQSHDTALESPGLWSVLTTKGCKLVWPGVSEHSSQSLSPILQVTRLHNLFPVLCYNCSDELEQERETTVRILLGFPLYNTQDNLDLFQCTHSHCIHGHYRYCIAVQQLHKSTSYSKRKKSQNKPQEHTETNYSCYKIQEYSCTKCTGKE